MNNNQNNLNQFQNKAENTSNNSNQHLYNNPQSNLNDTNINQPLNNAENLNINSNPIQYNDQTNSNQTINGNFSQQQNTNNNTNQNNQTQYVYQNNSSQYQNENFNSNPNTPAFQSDFSQNTLNNNNYINNIEPLPENKKKKRTIKIVIIIIVVAIAIYFIINLLLAMLAANVTTNYLDEARKQSFADSAIALATAAEYIYIMNDHVGEQCYSLNSLNQQTDRTYEMTPFGTNYSSSSYATVREENMNRYISICLVDEEGNGIAYTSEENLSSESVVTNVTCILPPECN